MAKKKSKKNNQQKKELKSALSLDIEKRAKELSYNTTSDISVSKEIINQVVGQEEAVEVIKKAAQQRRHVLLVGEPGTGKSMLGLALAELLPKEKLVDIVAFLNPNDENQPLIRAMPAGKARDIVFRARLDVGQAFRSQNIIMFILLFMMSGLSYWLWKSGQISDIIFAASFISIMIFFASLIIFMGMGKRADVKVQVPKVVVDNFGKKQAPFMDATGAHAGALLGDVLHDPYQCFFPSVNLNCVDGGINKSATIKYQVDHLFDKKREKITKKERNYEAIFLKKYELFVLGENNGVVSPVEVLSSNRHIYKGKMIKLTTAENKEIIVTPKHKIAANKNGKITYVEADLLKEGDEILAKAEDIIIDEQSIINTYDAKQQEQCKLCYQYLSIEEKNPSWGYKRIAKAMNQNSGKTRWWHAKKHIPVPIQTANWLKEKGLLPLKTDNHKAPLIAKVLGATFGDGGVFENLNGIFLSSSEKEAVEEFGKDLENIFGLTENKNSRIIEGGEKGHSWCYQNTNRNIIRFFLALGAPKGNKTKTDLNIPNWIYLSEQFADEFFGSLFGSELRAPKVHKQKNRLQTLDIGITGPNQLEDNRAEFLNRVKRYLDFKEVATTSLLKQKTHNERLYMYRLIISVKFDNVIKFIKNVKINYCIYKKKKIINALNEFSRLKKKKYQEVISKGYGAEHAMKVLNLTPNSLYTILNEEVIEA